MASVDGSNLMFSGARRMGTESVPVLHAVAVMSRDEARAEHARICASDDEALHCGDAFDHLCRRLRVDDHARGGQGWQREAAARLDRMRTRAGLADRPMRIARRFQDLWDDTDRALWAGIETGRREARG